MIKVICFLLVLATPSQLPRDWKTRGVYDVAVPGHLIAWDGNPIIVKTDKVAYERSLREAKILAKQDHLYPMWGDNDDHGHPLGCAPNCRRSGTGYSWNGGRPHHCEQGSRRKLVARARVRSKSGRWFWSTQYR